MYRREKGGCYWDSRKSSSGSSRNGFSCDTKVLIICVVGVGEFPQRFSIVFSQQLDLCWRSFVHSFIHSFIHSFLRSFVCLLNIFALFCGFFMARKLPTIIFFFYGYCQLSLCRAVERGEGTKKIINKNKVNQKKFMFPGNQQNLML